MRVSHAESESELSSDDEGGKERKPAKLAKPVKPPDVHEGKTAFVRLVWFVPQTTLVSTAL